MKLSSAGLFSLCLAQSVGAATLPQAPTYPVQSASGQFSVQLSVSTRPPRLDLISNPDLFHLDPTLLTISAERLRQCLMRELQDHSRWQGRILFSLRPAESTEEPVEVLAEWQLDHWQYQVSLPDYLAQDRFVRALVEVNLMEMANGASPGRATDVPAWLTEGFTEQLLASRSIEIILPPPKLKVRGMNVTPWQVERRTLQPLALAHAKLQTNAPLSIEQLSWPVPESLQGRSGETYRYCAQLLVTQLLRLPGGPARLDAFIRELGRHYNWQVAFLNTYTEEFPSLLDFEKWWALQVAHFTGRELGATYAYGDSVLRLKQAVRLPVEVRLHSEDLPMHSEIRLQTIIEEWAGERQRRALEQVLQELTLLRARIAPELIGLLDNYRLTLQGYLRDRNRSGLYLPKGINRQVTLNVMVHRTLKTLDALDAELDSLLPEPSSGNDNLAASNR